MNLDDAAPATNDSRLPLILHRWILPQMIYTHTHTRAHTYTHTTYKKKNPWKEKGAKKKRKKIKIKLEYFGLRLPQIPGKAFSERGNKQMVKRACTNE